jgi:putative glycosyltransferase (TIGR04372 family)
MPLMKNKLQELLRKIEVDKAVFFGILSKIWSVIASPLTAFLIVIKFTPEFQGYYYTFGSLLALQVFVELGLGTVIIQFASHEWADLRIDDNGAIAGSKEALSRLVSLANIASKWYLVGGILIAFCLGLVGYIFFSQKNASHIDWSLPWFSLCFFTGITICITPLWSLLEGCNQVTSVYTYRFFQGVAVSLSIWIAILAGAKLWVAPISVAVSVCCALIYLKYNHCNFIKSLLFADFSGPGIGWFREIFPMQWRMALSWMSGYFVFSLFTPVIFHYHGSVVAGQFGMTWSVIGMASMISGAWIYPKMPQFGILIARKEYAKLDRLFWRITKVLLAINTLTAIALWCTIYLLNVLNSPFANRLLPILPATIFLLAQFIMMLPLQFSMYLIAHKKNPIFLISVLAGATIGLSTFILGKYSSVTAIGLGYLSINLIIAPLIVLVWYRCRQTWHKDDQGDVEISLRKEYICRRIKEKGIFYCVRKAAQQVFYKIICQLVGLLGYPICRLMNVKFIFLSERAIGHLCIETDCYIKEGVLGLRQEYKTIMVAPDHRVANAHLLGYWKKYLKIICSPWLCVLLEPFARSRLTGYSTYRFAFSANSAYFPEIQKRYNGRSPLLSLSDSDRQSGWACLRDIGITEGSWFVCVHCREDGYLGKLNQSLRNADISNYLLAAEAIVKRGGWVIRMGDPTMKVLPAMERVIDYAHMDIKSEQMDVFLCATCKFFLGSDSGLYHVSSVFGVPAAIANYAHLSGVLPYGPGDIGVPKLIWSHKEGRYLSFKEILGSSRGHFLFDNLFIEAGLQPIENSPEDIRDLAVEMLDKTEGNLSYTKEDDLLQERFKSLMKPNHYSFGAISRVGRDFLRKYAFLLNG